MALMSDIIGKYQKEANDRIAEARRGDPEKIKEKKELLDTIILSKGSGTEIAPASPDVGKGNIFKTVPNTEIRKFVKNYNEGGATQTTSPTPQQKLQDTVIISSGQQREQEDVFKKVSRLEDENKKLREELAKLKK